MQQQHQYVLGDWTVPQHPHAPVGMTPNLHLWPHHVAPPGPRLPSSKMHQSTEDYSGRLGGKNVVLQQPANLHVQSHNGEPFSSGYSENWHDQKEAPRGHNGTFVAPSSAPLPAEELHHLMLAQFGQVHRDPRMQSMMPYCAPYSSQGWYPEHMAPDAHMPGALHSGRNNGYDCGVATVSLTNGEMQHHIGSYMTHGNAAMYNHMPNGSMHGSTIPPPVTDLRTLQAVLREAKPGSGQVAEALLQVAFPLRLPGLTAIMGRFTKSGQWAVSLDIFDTLPALALPRDTTVCNAALAACMRGCLWQRAKQAFDLMITQGVPLDNITYCTMLSVPRRRKLWRVTMDLFLHMCQAEVKPVLPDVAGMLSEISQDGKWALSEKLFNYVFRHVPVLAAPQHIDSAVMKDMNASDLQIVRMLNNAMRQTKVPTATQAPATSVGMRSTIGESLGPYRVFPLDTSPMTHANVHGQFGHELPSFSGIVGSSQTSGTSVRQSSGPDSAVEDITSSMSGLSFERPSSSETLGQTHSHSRSNSSESRPSWQDPTVDSILQQAAAVASREGGNTPDTPELVCCNELLSVYLRCGLQQRASELLRRMLMVGGVFTPGIGTCHRFLTTMY